MNRRIFLLVTIALSIIINSQALAQIYPVLFFRIEEVAERSLEIIDLRRQEEAAHKAYAQAMESCDQKWRALPHCSIPCSSSEVDLSNYQKCHDQISQDITVATTTCTATSFSFGIVIEEKVRSVYKKINAIVEDICKARGAYAVTEIKLLPYSIQYIDPACDITDEVYNRLNQEYLKSKEV